MSKTKLFLALLFLPTALYAGKYSVKVNEQITIYSTATPPAGYITHVFYTLTDPKDAEYISISSNPEDGYAIITGRSPKSSIKIEVTYCYTYLGTYDNKTHVGHGTYYDYITVTGAPKPNSIRIEPDNVTMNVGETITLKAVPTPTNATANYTWGIISTLGRPSAFDLKYENEIAYLTAEREGYIYIVLESDNGYTSIAYVRAVEGGANSGPINLEEIKFLSDRFDVFVGEEKSITYKLLPAGASAKLTWKSSNEKIATVTSTGQIKGINAGKTRISLTAENGVFAEVDVYVNNKPERIITPETVTVCTGYEYTITPILEPKDSKTEYKWASDNTNIATIDNNGRIITRQEGICTITVSTSNGLKETIQLNVVNMNNRIEHRNAKARVNRIKSIVNRTLIYK